MAFAIITYGTTTVHLENYAVEIVPNWEQPKIFHKSVLTDKITMFYKDADKKGRYTVRIRVFDADNTIFGIGDQESVRFKLLGIETSYTKMLVKEFLTFEAKNRYNMRKMATILLESEVLVDNPIIVSV